MSEKSTNQLIAEWMGLCWHESDNPDYATVRCRKCGSGFGGLGSPSVVLQA